MTYDLIIENGRWFDGTGAPSQVRNLGIRDGRVAIVTSEDLDATGCGRVIDATGHWVLPGMIDIHTHYDVEVLVQPALLESLRHGITTVFLGSCSLSTVHASPSDAGDLFGRVEAIPRPYVVGALEEMAIWRNAREYVEALERLPLGPNLAAFIGHSDIRAARMGLARSTDPTVRPTAAELDQMATDLADALDQGFVGMSSQELMFDKLDGETCRSRTLPSTYARGKERRRLNRLLRSRGRALQGGPDVAKPQSLLRMAFSSCGWGRSPGLKVSLLSAADIKAIPLVAHLFPLLARTVNRFGGNLRFQHLPVPFEVYSDGIALPVFEEFGSGAAALHLSNKIDQQRSLLADENYRRWFRKDYEKKYGPRVWHRDFFDAEITECPDASVVGKTFGQVGVDRGGVHPVDAFLDLVVEYGEKVRWRTTISNHRPDVLNKLTADPGVQLGFSDAGAHLRNMAFYNFGLRLLRRVHDAETRGTPFMSIEHAVHRITGELADWYGIDAGHLREGDRADLVVIDPQRLDSSLDDYAEEPVAAFGHLSRMVNRNDATVAAVLVGGEIVVEHGAPADIVGTRRTGRFLGAS
jgi:N-acyl-D-aspartate/D-glutamate deacylase